MNKKTLREKVSTVPRKPGVYLLKGSRQDILYVGKAKSLRARLSSYFQNSKALDQRKAAMVRVVRDFEFITTDNELEALALEATLIKRHKPKYNIVLRDDKNYPYLKLSTKDPWPRLEVVRRIKRDGSVYFGPYVPAGAMKEALKIIRKHFGLRPCAYRLDKKPMRPCIQHQMGRCPAPCAGLVSKAEYKKAVNDVVLFLRGKGARLLSALEQRMLELSKETLYEEAAKVRDRIIALKRVWESQKVISPGLGDLDVVGLHRAANTAVFKVFFIRGGIMIGARDFRVSGVRDMSGGQLMHSFLESFYIKEIIPPREVVLASAPDGSATLLEWLSERRGQGEGGVRITRPKGGKKFELLRLASENAEEAYKGGSAHEKALKEIKQRLRLKSIPESIGAFDVSNISGTDSAGAFVYWVDGDFDKDMYRHAKIRTVAGQDDYAMMAETVTRVLKDMEAPDLILIDGGRGQLDAARKTFLGEIDGPGGPAEAGGPELVAIAKKPDRAFTLYSDEPVSLDDGSPSSLLLRRIRDEAHRFVLSFHRKLRSKRLMESVLEKAPGIGKKRRLALLKSFGSVEAVRKADVEELAAVPGMNIKAAQALKAALGGK